MQAVLSQHMMATFVLPTEVLRNIFLYALPDHAEETPRPCISEAPLLLCRVSPSWRNLARRTPALWARISLRVVHYYSEKGYSISRHTMDALDGWFSSYEGPPQKVQLRFDNPEFVPHVEEGVQINHLFASVSISNTRGLDIRTSFLHNLFSMYGIEANHEFQELESLTLWVDNSIPSANTPAPFPPSPQLRHLVLHGYLQDNFPVTTLFPWSQLTHIASECFINPTTWRSIISHCTNIQDASFFLCGEDQNMAPDSKSPSTHTHTLLFLKRLVISLVDNLQRDGETVDNLFKGLDFPLLNYLRVSSFSTEVRVLDWTSLFKKRTPSLTQLHIGPFLDFDHTRFFCTANYHLRNLESLTLDLSTETPPLHNPISPNLFSKWILARAQIRDTRCIRSFELIFTEGHPCSLDITDMVEELNSTNVVISVVTNPPYHTYFPPKFRWNV